MPSRPAPNIKVYVNGIERPDLRPITVQRSCGGRNVDYAVIHTDRSVGYGRHPITAISLKEENTDLLEIRDADTNKVYFFGRRSQTQVSISERGDAESTVYRIEPYMFGGPVWGQWVWNPLTNQHEHVDTDLIFNPVYNGRIVFNLRPDHPLGTGRTGTFLDPASIQSPTSVEFQGEGGVEWTLANVVNYLCWQANPEQYYIRNPNPSRLAAALFRPGNEVRDLHIPPGLYLPDLLDRVLSPFGYFWFVENAGPGTRQIRVYRRGEGTRKRYASLQRPYANVVAGPDKPFGSNTVGANVTYDISDVYNQVRGLGDFIEVESTFELFKGWPQSKDNLPDHYFRPEHPDYEFNKDVWHKWVLNEAGDYNGFRPEIRGATPIAFGQAGLSAPPRRRRFRPMLTYDVTEKNPIGKHDGRKVEWFDPQLPNLDNPNTRGGWREWEHGVSILPDECGVRFSYSMDQFNELKALGNAARVRITATIRLDTRIQGLVEFDPLSRSPQSDPVELLLDLRNRFHYRIVHWSSMFYDDVRKGRLKADERDDHLDLQAYCQRIHDAFHMASINGPIEIEGLDYDYELGDSIIGILGRDISFNMRTGDTQPQYPQVAGITYDFQRQRTLLQLEHFRQPVRFLRDKQGIDLE